MRFAETALPGVFVITPDRHEDSRGAFTRTWCRRDFAAHGIDADFVQTAISDNDETGTLRGLHFQAAPYGERKLVSCIAGRAFDVVVDLRPGSATFGRWVSVEIGEADGTAVYIPEGCAHGFQTLAPETRLHYQISEYYQPELARGVRWNDPDLAIAWPLGAPTVISARDAKLPSVAQYRYAETVTA